MRISDWSSDVCSSDLRIVAFDGDLARIGDRSGEGAVGHDAEAVAALGERPVEIAVIVVVLGGVILVEDDLAAVGDRAAAGRGRADAGGIARVAADRKSVV